MPELQNLANWSDIVSAGISLIALIIAFVALRHQIQECNKKIDNVSTRIDTFYDIVSLQLRLQSQTGTQYHDCTFFGKQVDDSVIRQQYTMGMGVAKNA